MIDRELKANIKKTKEFIVLWVKFHDLYKSAIKKEAITQEEEAIFLETKLHITNKYKALKDALKLPEPDVKDEAIDVMSHVLSLQGMTTISDDALDGIENSWRHSYAFLNDMLKNLEQKDKELGKRSVLLEAVNRMLSKKAVQLVILILGVFITFCLISLLIQIIVK